MAYLTIKQVKEKYQLSDKTIRRLYEGKTISRSQGYKNKKGKWVINSDYLDSKYPDRKLDTQPIESTAKDQPKTSQTASESQALLKTIEVLQYQLKEKDRQKEAQRNLEREILEELQNQLKEKDRQLERYDQKLDQQQKLTAQLQNQLLIASPTEPITATQTTQPPKPQTQPKKAVRQAKKSPQAKQKTTKPKKKRWWSRG